MGHYYTEKQYDTAKPATLMQKDHEFPYMPYHPIAGEHQRLIGKLGNGLYYIYPDLTEESEFKMFYNNYASGHWLSFEVRVIEVTTSRP